MIDCSPIAELEHVTDRASAWFAAVHRRYHVNLYITGCYLIADINCFDLVPRQAALCHERVEHHHADQLCLAQFCQLDGVAEMVAVRMRYKDMTRMVASQIFIFERRRRIFSHKRIN